MVTWKNLPVEVRSRISGERRFEGMYTENSNMDSVRIRMANRDLYHRQPSPVTEAMLCRLSKLLDYIVGPHNSSAIDGDNADLEVRPDPDLQGGFIMRDRLQAHREYEARNGERNMSKQNVLRFFAQAAEARHEPLSLYLVDAEQGWDAHMVAFDPPSYKAPWD